MHKIIIRLPHKRVNIGPRANLIAPSDCYNTITPVVVLKVAYAHYGKHVVPWPSLAFLRHQFICRQISLCVHAPFFSTTLNFQYCASNVQHQSHSQICSCLLLFMSPTWGRGDVDVCKGYIHVSVYAH